MARQKTLAIIKPDAVAAGNMGAIVSEIEKNKFKIAAMKLLHLTTAEAEGFYAVHREKPFFKSLVAFMTQGPVAVMMLERDDAIAAWREIMGATNPAEAAEGSIRKRFGTSIERNATHGSDAEETAAFETTYFFSSIEAV